MFRWLLLISLVGTMSISAHYRRRARQESEIIERAREGPLLMAARAFIALPLFLGVIVYVVNPNWMAWASFTLPTWARWAGAVLGLLSIPSAYWVFSSIGRNVSETVLTKRDHELVTTGPYRWVRHPLYSTGLSLFLGAGLMMASWFVLSIVLVVLILVRLVVIPREERELVHKFGDAYRTYMRGTGRLLPRIVS